MHSLQFLFSTILIDSVEGVGYLREVINFLFLGFFRKCFMRSSTRRSLAELGRWVSGRVL